MSKVTNSFQLEAQFEAEMRAEYYQDMIDDDRLSARIDADEYERENDNLCWDIN